MSGLEDRFEILLKKLADIEMKVTQKADDIVLVQVLQHRNEMDDLESRINQIENRLNGLAEIDEIELEVVEVIESKLLKKQSLTRRLASIFML